MELERTRPRPSKSAGRPIAHIHQDTRIAVRPRCPRNRANKDGSRRRSSSGLRRSHYRPAEHIPRGTRTRNRPQCCGRRGSNVETVHRTHRCPCTSRRPPRARNRRGKYSGNRPARLCTRVDSHALRSRGTHLHLEKERRAKGEIFRE